MIEIVRREIPISESESIDIQVLDTIEKEDAVLLCIMTGNPYQSHSYFPAEFKQKDDRYEFVAVYSLYQRGADVYSYSWRDGYLFVVNNENCRSIAVISRDGDAETLEVAKIPFVTYREEAPAEYYFLDSEGKELR
ncbi:MAG: hypothetical protein AAGU74_08615 [Bacillota bacterium]